MWSYEKVRVTLLEPDCEEGASSFRILDVQAKKGVQFLASLDYFNGSIGDPRASFRPASVGSNPKRNLGLSDSEGPRFPLRIRIRDFWGHQHKRMR